MEIFTLTVVCMAILAGLFVRSRKRLRDESRRALLERTVDPARGRGPLAHEADAGHDPSA